MAVVIGSLARVGALTAMTVDDTNDRMPLDLADQTWTAVSAGAVTDLVICYDSDTTAGTDSNIAFYRKRGFEVVGHDMYKTFVTIAQDQRASRRR